MVGQGPGSKALPENLLGALSQASGNTAAAAQRLSLSASGVLAAKQPGAKTVQIALLGRTETRKALKITLIPRQRSG